MTEWSQFISRQTIQHYSNPSLCPNHWYQRSWSWPVLWRPTTSSRINTTHTHTNVLFIIGDWNAKVESQEIPGIAGKFGLGVQNETGHMLTEFHPENTLVIAKPLFQQHRKTALHMDVTRQSILKSDWLYSFQLKWGSSIQLAKTRPGADCGLDHQLPIA